MWARQMKTAKEKQLRELACSSNMAAEQVTEAGKTAAKSERDCRANVAQVQSWLQSQEQRQVRLQEEMDQCKQQSQRLHQAWLSKF